MSAPADYDLNEIFDALRLVIHGLETGDSYGGSPVTITAYSEVTGNIETPAVVLELDDITYDLNMGDGADGITIVAACLVQNVDEVGAQRAMRAFMSRKDTSGVARLKDAMDVDTTLGGLVSFVQFSTVRRIGTLTYDKVDYLGAELIFEVVT